MQEYGKLLVLVGVIIAMAGAWIWSGRGFGWLGRLPGDISYQSGDFRFYFPVTTLCARQCRPDLAGLVFAAMKPYSSIKVALGL